VSKRKKLVILPKYPPRGSLSGLTYSLKFTKLTWQVSCDSRFSAAC